MKQRFGEFLIEKGVVDPFSLVKALNIQRRRGLIPLGEIALHDKLLSAENLLDILDEQESTGRRFGDIAIGFEYLCQSQIDILIKKQGQLHSRIGEILVEMNKFSLVELDALLVEFRQHDFDQEDKGALPPPESSLFIDVEACCPICGEVSSQRIIDNSLYEIEKNDIDLKPSEYRWDSSDHCDENPLLYDFWKCPYCSFSLGHDDFSEPTRDIPASISNFKKKVIELYTKDECVGAVINVLSVEEDKLGDNSYISVVRNYLLAIHLYSKIHMVADQEGAPLADLCLHLAWVYRDMHRAQSADIYIKELKRIKVAVGDVWPSVPLTETAALEMALYYYDVAVYQSRSLVERGIEHKVLQLMARINIRLKRIKEARRLLLDTVMNGNKQIAALKASLKPESSEFNKVHNKNVMQDLCRVNAFVKETKALLEFCSTLKQQI